MLGQLLKSFCRVSSQKKRNLGKSFFFFFLVIDKEGRFPNEMTITGHVAALLDLSK